MQESEWEGLDVAEVLMRLKREIREQHQDSWMAIALSRESALEEVRATSWINPHRPIAWPHWPRGLLPKLVALMQKIIRRGLRWYIHPIVEDQNRFNAAVVRALEILAQENAQLRAELRALSADGINTSESG